MHRTPDRREERSGYPEKQPLDGEDARKTGPQKKPDPDEGGLDRAPEQDGTNEEAE
ncbi:hypothetical protein [Luteimonas saliphila]|uniref:hypothetical protein n=1 Tax=Luteimonas saliphila TaxID=2804919 RepID=UPI00192E211C|nr:hypothetical protein [Luteimonas saliphila]